MKPRCAKEYIAAQDPDDPGVLVPGRASRVRRSNSRTRCSSIDDNDIRGVAVGDPARA
jgi:hypothetical protein